jgi:hypothetical protein
VESANDLIKDWRNFTAQDMDKLIMALYELIGSVDEEEELAWFGLSEKWEVRAENQRLWPKGFSNMTSDQRQGEITKMRKIRPYATAYNNCKSFKFSSPQESEQVSGSLISLILFEHSQDICGESFIILFRNNSLLKKACGWQPDEPDLYSYF